jgi:hypothetical protein
MVYGNSDMDMLVAIPCPSPTSITDASLPPWTECGKLAQLDDLDQGVTSVGWRLLKQPLDLHFHLPSLLHRRGSCATSRPACGRWTESEHESRLGRPAGRRLW